MTSDSFQKASLCERDSQSSRITFHFNPSSVKIAKRSEFKEQPTQAAREAARPKFLGALGVDLQFSILLDASVKRQPSVMPEIQKLLDWTNPTEKSRQSSSPSPPVLLFDWGEFVVGRTKKFVGHLKSVDANCTMFTRSGAPTRAEVSLALRAVPEELAGTNPTSGGVRARLSHQVVAGDTLAAVAHRVYGDPNCWRAVAEANGIDDPLRLVVGTHLLLPDRADFDRW